MSFPFSLHSFWSCLWGGNVYPLDWTVKWDHGSSYHLVHFPMWSHLFGVCVCVCVCVGGVLLSFHWPTFCFIAAPFSDYSLNSFPALIKLSLTCACLHVAPPSPISHFINARGHYAPQKESATTTTLSSPGTVTVTNTIKVEPSPSLLLEYVFCNYLHQWCVKKQKTTILLVANGSCVYCKTIEWFSYSWLIHFIRKCQDKIQYLVLSYVFVIALCFISSSPRFRICHPHLFHLPSPQSPGLLLPLTRLLKRSSKLK